ncbi:hypothetical protein CfE428DRAFT_4687 [Chthoniobacter flavus Ellin428]|uniref:SbsA Ig-like domain-containing protein n=1 Tax=Chthoniobacter flavus Ellin428 TaxID=497964 RepID=B4D6Z7_9BACT|nr:Ig-like domain-containing protein [Chthoniobacter flavus]EDY17948.1 hypothetical protein CfE428DRAFT_4687 [Chthoniobacter flavus Ellin428]TCO88554.1 Ig-like domain-containing protein [Chthoniobacter flavus]
MVTTLSSRIARGTRLARNFVLLLLVLAPLKAFTDNPVPPDVPSGYPPWWFQRGVMARRDLTNEHPQWANHDYPDPDDFSVANLGELKQIATQAAAEFNAHFPGGAGADINNLVNEWLQPNSNTDDFSALNQGQLKAVAKLFYDRLTSRKWVLAYPWNDPATTRDGDDYAVANVGQIKNLFSFDLVTDSNNDGIPDWVVSAGWGAPTVIETGNVVTGSDMAPGGVTYAQKFSLGLDPSKADSDGDGATDGEELAAGTDPLDPASSPYVVAGTWPINGSYGFPINGVVVVYLNKALPDSITNITPNFVIRRTLEGFDADDQPIRTESVESGTATILPGRKSIAFVSTNNLVERPDDDPGFNYIIRFNADTAGLATIPPTSLPTRPDISFATNHDLDDTGPAISAVSPGENYIEVAYDVVIGVLWTQVLDPATVTADQVTVWPDGGAAIPVTLGFDYGSDVMKITPQAPLSPNTLYHVSLGTGFANLRGLPLQNSFTWSFQTRPLPTPVNPGGGPYVASIDPAPYGGGVSPGTRVRIAFSEDMNATTLNANTVTVLDDRSRNVPVSLSYTAGDRTLTLSFAQPLAYNTRYEVDLQAASILAAGNPAQPLQGDSSFAFTTVVDPSGGLGGGTGSGGSGNGGGPNPPDIDFGAGGGSAGNRDTTVPPLTLTLIYGDADYDDDSGGNVKAIVQSVDGNRTTPQFRDANNETVTVNTSPLDGRSVIYLTPTFIKGSDDDVQEEQQENFLNISVPDQSKNGGAMYMVFLKSGSDSAPSYQYQGQLSNGSYTAKFDDGSGTGPQSLLLVPVVFTVEYTPNSPIGAPPNWHEKAGANLAYLGSGGYRTTAKVQNVPGITFQMGISQNIRSTTTVVFEDDSYTYCSTDQAPGAPGGYLPDPDIVQNPSDFVHPPNYTSVATADFPTEKIQDQTRPYLKTIMDDGYVRDYLTIQINGGAAQTIAEVDWSFRSSASFTANDLSNATTHFSTNFQSSSINPDPKPPKVYYGSDPGADPVPDSLPSANQYFNNPQDWPKFGKLANTLPGSWLQK